MAESVEDAGNQAGDDGDGQGMMDTSIDAIEPLVGIVLGAHLARMGPKSLFNLATGLNAMRREDIEGSLTVYVTAKKGHSLEVEWQSGQP